MFDKLINLKKLTGRQDQTQMNSTDLFMALSLSGMSLLSENTYSLHSSSLEWG